ncbi:hypothetical protein ACVWZK_001488 [Bradyrhizobium sp. GM0.4]
MAGDTFGERPYKAGIVALGLLFRNLDNGNERSEYRR